MAARIRGLKDSGSLYFDSGDSIRTGNLGIPLRREQVWDLLGAAGCDASVPGNRESHVLESAFQKKLAGASHPVLCANLRRKDGELVLAPSLVLTDASGIRVGVVAVMVPMVTRRMASSAASAFLWDPPIPCATEIAERLRPHADVLIALTHIGFRQDLALAEACPLFDVVLGGHSHTVLETPERVGSTWICQGGSHGRFVGIYEWDAAERRLAGGLVPLS